MSLFQCPCCFETVEAPINDSRTGANNSVRRRRVCSNCDRRYTTYERIEKSPMRVIKREGSRVNFKKQNILNSLIKACEKRPVSLECLHEIASTITVEINRLYEKEIPSREIGRLCLEHLKKLDDVAYIRYASVFHQVEDAKQFMELVRTIKGTKRAS